VSSTAAEALEGYRRAVADAAGHRSAAESYEYDIEPRIVSDELEPDRGCAFAGGQVQAVLDEVRAVRFRDLSREPPGVFDVLAFEPRSRSSPNRTRSSALTPCSISRSSWVAWEHRSPGQLRTVALCEHEQRTRSRTAVRPLLHRGKRAVERCFG